MVNYISVRDEKSKEYLGKKYQNKCFVVPDTINIISEIYQKEELINNQKRLIKAKTIPKLNDYIIFQTKIISENQNLYIEKIKELLKYITDIDGKDVLLMPIGYVHNDKDFCISCIKPPWVHCTGRNGWTMNQQWFNHRRV